MARQVVNRGSAANDGTGDNLRDGAGKINDNFTELYTAFGDGSTITAGTFITDTGTHTLTNKSIDLTDNTLTGTTAEFNTALTDNDFATLAGSETLTNKVINASNNTLSNIGNSALTNSSISIIADDSSAQSISLGGSILFTGGSGITTSISGNEISFVTDGSIVTETSTDTLTNKSIDATTNTLSNITNTELSGSAGITNANLANSSITIRDDSSTTDAISLGETLVVTGGSGIDTAIASNELTLSVSGLTNTNLSGSAGITNANFDNSSITLGATAINLGDTAGSATNFNLSGTSSLSGTGTINTTGSGNKLRFNVAAADASALGTAINPTTYEGMFAYNTTENYPYVADTAGWTRILTENDSIGDLSNVTIAGIADTNVLAWNSSNARFEPVAAASASPTPAWSVTNASNQSLSDDVLTRVVFDTEVLDTDNAFASNVFTVPVGEGGKYFIGFRVFVDDIDASNYCMAYLEVNGVAEGGTDVQIAHSSTTNVNLHSNTLVDLSAGDEVEVVCKITGAGTQELRSGTFNTLFYGWKVA